VGAFSINLGVVLVAGTFILFLLKGFEREMLLGFFLMLILSDNYFLHYPGIVKPLLLVLLGIYILLRSEIRNEAMLIKSFIPFFIYTIMLWPLSDYLAIAVQKNAAYILLFFAIPPLFHHLYKRYDAKWIQWLVYFLFAVLIFNFLYRFLQPEAAYSHGGRLKAFFGNPNGLGMFCFFSLLFFEVAKRYFKIECPKYFVYFFYGLAAVLLVQTSSRASMFSILIFYGFLFISRFSTLIAFFSVIVLIITSQFLVDPLVALLIDFGLGDTLRLNTEGAQSVAAGSGRLIAWNLAWEQIQANFFFGKAWGHEEELFHSPAVKVFLNALNHEGGAHNVYLIFWMNTGLIGLLLFFGGFFSVFLRAIRKSELALPILIACLFLAFFEPWLAAALNPYTILLLMILTSFLYCKPEPERIET